MLRVVIYYKRNNVGLNSYDIKNIKDIKSKLDKKQRWLEFL